MTENLLLRSELEEVRERLERFKRQADALLELIDNRRLFGAEKREARDLYREFKDGLSAEYHRGATMRGTASLTEVERRFYHHAIHEALCDLRLPVNCVPDARLFSEIYSAQSDIEYALEQVEKQLAFT